MAHPVMVMVMDVPNSDGPESGGASWLFIVQPDDIVRTAARAAVTVARIGVVRFIGYRRSLPPPGPSVEPSYFLSAKLPKFTPSVPVALTGRPV